MPIRDWYEREMVDGNRSGAFWLLLSLLITFLIVRGITRRIRSDRTAACCATSASAACTSTTWSTASASRS